MSQAATKLTYDREGFEAFLDTRDEPDWLVDKRRSAFDAFERLDWPGRREEEWSRTDIRLFNLNNFSLPGETAAGDSLPAATLAEGVQLGGRMTSHNGRLHEEQLASKWASKGVLFGSLSRIAAEHPEVVKPHLSTRAVLPDVDRFTALQAAFWSGGSLLYVPRGVTIDEPLHVLSALSDGAADMGHLLVILEDGAEATLLAESGSESQTAAGLHCGASELIQAPGSHLRYVSLQDWGHGVWHFGRQTAIVDRDASLQWTMAALGSRLSKVNQQVAMVGRGANCQVNGVMFTEGKQHLSFHTLQHHQTSQCKSDFLYKAALQDRSRTVWRGMIKVDPAAQQTDGYQRNDNLLLSNAARADSIPGLEIEADDVRCTHGSTSGKVDEELIFYAQCRGFTRKEAIRAIVAGFFQQVFDRITIDSVRESLGHAIARRVREYE